jgi:hypothetical protein
MERSTRKISANSQQKPAWYGIIWTRAKQFPSGLARGSDSSPSGSGEAAAALISAAIGCVVMMISHHLSDGDKSKTIEKFIHNLGAWIPGSKNPDPMWGNIGSYTGKETMLLIGWTFSWAILYLLYKDKRVKVRELFIWLIGLMTLATAMCWHPLFPYLPLT